MKDLFDSIGIYYDLIYKEKNYLSETNFIINSLKQFGINEKLVLEFGSGTGKHAAKLVENGFKVDGIEKSSTLISLIEPKKNFNCFKGDIRNIKLNKKYDAVLSLFHVISYLTSNEDLDKVFENASFHLKPNGVFLFDFCIIVLRNISTSFLLVLDDKLSSLERFFDIEAFVLIFLNQVL